jgi:SAM-dependent methyltransferase
VSLAGEEEDDIRKLGTVSTPGSWTQYYNMAEYNMDEQWSKIYPMINESDFGTVLEVAAGACRNTEKLLPLSDHIIVTDIDPTAVASCKHRFANRSESNKIGYMVVDGVHLPVGNGTITMVYQFDSGVHFHREVIRNYLKEFARVLTPGGTGFFHHSNLAAAPGYHVHDDLDVTKNPAWRSNMSVAEFKELVREAGLEMMCHPIVNWAGQPSIDGIARFRKPGGVAQKVKELCPAEVDFPRDPRIALVYLFNFLFLFVCTLIALIFFICVMFGLRACKTSKKRYRNRYENQSPWRGQ